MYDIMIILYVICLVEFDKKVVEFCDEIKNVLYN